MYIHYLFDLEPWQITLPVIRPTMEPTPNGENKDIFYLINFNYWPTPKLSVS